MKEGTAQIAARQAELNELRPKVTEAETSLARTEQVDRFLDTNVVWLDQFRRLAHQMPPADQAILNSVSAVSVPREGGGRLTIAGAATSPTVVDEMESSLRDEEHSVSGSGANDRGEKEAYRWGFTQTVTVAREAIRRQRYEAFAADDDEGETAQSQTGAAEPESDAAEPVDDQPAETPAVDAPPEMPSDTPPTDNFTASESAASQAAEATVQPESSTSDTAPAPQDAPENTVEQGSAAPQQNAPEESLPETDATEDGLTQ